MNYLKLWLFSRAIWAAPEGPLPVYGGGCALWKDRLYMIGGTSATGKLAEEVLSLDLGGGSTWKAVSKHPASFLGTSITAVSMGKEGISLHWRNGG
ncbi:hypothetical protein DSO57_1011504 [Entomophthora muscae]|uniref:Uncharacterized protein n=1 Tax=Entomophthora muscae TaxID=34485 RepID=A0ACC2TTR8_9FUNG|nr:hypothetical protein DSO57_1011504 [Entomophthora muscae]